MHAPLAPQIELGHGGPRFWKSLEEWSHGPDFLPWLQREFPALASEWPSEISRRRFLQLMGASFALAGLTACSRQAQDKLVPYVQRPEEIVPGRPLYYATTFPHRGRGKGVLVRTDMGRPTKVEGNPDHPASLGATDIWMQASILGLYDPDRSRVIREGEAISTWNEFTRFVRDCVQEHDKDQGAGLFLLTGPNTSPSLAGQMQRLRQRFPKMTWCTHDLLEPTRARSVSGAKAEPTVDLSHADLIVSLDADFLYDGPTNLVLTKAFSQKRRVPESGSFSRLYVVESAPSVTGAKADVRWRRKPSEIPLFAQQLADAVMKGATAASPEVRRVAADLQEHRGRSVVLVGDYQPESVHALAFQLNQALGNTGTTITYREAPASPILAVALVDFLAALQQSATATLLIAGLNPVYDLPANFHFAETLRRVEKSIHLGLYDDETGERCRWHVPESHYLESWGDLLAPDGTPSLIQPVIQPLYPGTVSLLEVLSLLVDSVPRQGYDIVHDFWQQRLPHDVPAAFQHALNEGVISSTSAPPDAPAAEVTGVQDAPLPPSSTNGQLEIMFRADSSVEDGQFANNAWLQELPRPLTKLTWDNVAMVSPPTAKELGWTTGDVVRLESDGQIIDAPAWIQPGHADGCISVTLGYGRTRAGHVGNGVGFNAGLLRAGSDWWQPLNSAKLTGARHDLAATQLHFTMEGHDLIRVRNLDGSPASDRPREEAPDADKTLYPPVEYKNYAWAMSIDLNTCVGCNACIVACQSENNIPVVGKDQVIRGREMHWIRVDCYFEGAPDDPAMHFQPVTCMQCEDAPCEVVCPVGATVHSSEGLNDMVYNRCVGTRYCSNNCPYKVRRFNFLEYNAPKQPTLALMKNPDVTIRSRGVMEKCTYCVQRIEGARIEAQKAMRPIRDGDIITACQAACPAEAIVFGNLNDSTSRVSQLRRSPRNYGLLAELNTRPRTTYLEKLVNPS
jgi:molybdopterin-containing oxidoreductase family iron-sulfur binding subunit